MLMIKPLLCSFGVMGLAMGAASCQAQGTPEPPASAKAEGMVVLDYEVIRAPGNASLDLMGFHAFNRMNDWLYLGVGGYAPLFKGEYGGFMALDVSAHAQRRLFGNWFAEAGLSAGGGGGGKSRQQSPVLSGTGGFVKGYAGLGYELDDFSIGVNVARMKFEKSAIDSSQLNVYVQVPFSYTVGSYASTGATARFQDTPAATGTPEDAGENTLTLGADNYRQIRPEASRKSTINAADLQYSHFITRNSYWYFDAAVGYHGLPLYNHVLGGLGYRFPASARVNVYTQLGLGSGGYSPESIDTGPGLLAYPKVSAEYVINRNFGVALSAGYIFAPKASSKNYTLGASLNYHLHAADNGANASTNSAENVFKGYRIHLFQQTEFNVKTRNVAGSKLNLVAAQLDNVVDDHVYIPVQVGIAYNAYLGYPGYGELLAGVGVQNKYRQDDALQWFGQLLLGTNSQGAIVKTGVGLNWRLSDRLALYATAGQTASTTRQRFRSDQLGLGLTYRFSVPGR